MRNWDRYCKGAEKETKSTVSIGRARYGIPSKQNGLTRNQSRNGSVVVIARWQEKAESNSDSACDLSFGLQSLVDLSSLCS